MNAKKTMVLSSLVLVSIMMLAGCGKVKALLGMGEEAPTTTQIGEPYVAPPAPAPVVKPAPVCNETWVRPCRSLCEVGTETCTKGQWAQCTARQPVPEECNGIDDDCNGVVDDEFVALYKRVMIESSCAAGTGADLTAVTPEVAAKATELKLDAECLMTEIAKFGSDPAVRAEIRKQVALGCPTDIGQCYQDGLTMDEAKSCCKAVAKVAPGQASVCNGGLVDFRWAQAQKKAALKK